jgi:hypothetical protein
MQCINVYKKYRHGRDQADIFLCRQKKYTQICHIKKYRPGRTPLCEVYVLAYTCLNICRHVYFLSLGRGSHNLMIVSSNSVGSSVRFGNLHIREYDRAWIVPSKPSEKKTDCLEDDDSQLSIYNPNEVQPTVPCSEAIRIKRGYHVLASPSLWGLNWRMQVTNVNVYNFWISWLELGQLQLESPKIRSV